MQEHPHDKDMPTAAEISGSEFFVQICAKHKVEPTKRQAAKWRQKRGIL